MWTEGRITDETKRGGQKDRPEERRKEDTWTGRMPIKETRKEEREMDRRKNSIGEGTRNIGG
jgi:hypothetical protein